MNKSKLIYCFFLLFSFSLFTSCSDDDPIGDSTKVNITTPGTLKEVLGFDYLSMTKLTIQGTIDGDDISTIRNMSELTHLDIKDVFIVEGGSYLSYNPHNTKDVIPAQMFSKMTKLKVVILPKTVVSIENSAFLDCAELQSVTFSDHIKKIGYGAFSGCTNLTKINLPPNIISIGSNAFSGCTNLTKINLPPNIISIGYNAFKDCIGLTTITLPENLESIEDGVFYGCKSLTSVTVPNNIKTIGTSSFQDCESLALITIPNGIDRINQSTFKGCKGLKSVEIPSNVLYIFDEAFSDCSGLNTIVLPNVNQIGKAFTGCTGLKTINIGPDIEYIHYEAFIGSDNIEEYHIQLKQPHHNDYGYPFYPGIGADIKKSVTLFIPKGSTELYQNYFFGLWSGFKDYIEKY